MPKSIRKYEITLTKINTGEVEKATFHASIKITLDSEVLDQIFNTDEYKIDSIRELKTIVSIPVQPYCPN